MKNIHRIIKAFVNDKEIFYVEKRKRFLFFFPYWKRYGLYRDEKDVDGWYTTVWYNIEFLSIESAEDFISKKYVSVVKIIK